MFEFLNSGKGKKGGKSNIDPNLSPWQKPANNSKQQDGGNPAPPAGGNQPAPVDGNKELMEFFKAQGLFEQLDMQGFLKAVEAGDSAKAAEFMMQNLAATARVAMLGANKIAEAKIAKAVDESTRRASATVATELMTQALHSRLGFTSDPAIAPLAEQVLNQYLANGESADSAIEKTEKYFEGFALAAGQRYGLQPQLDSHGRAGQSGFQSSRMQQNDNGENAREPADWLDVLTSGAVTDQSSTQGASGGNPQGNAAAGGGAAGGQDSAAA